MRLPFLVPPFARMRSELFLGFCAVDGKQDHAHAKQAKPDGGDQQRARAAGLRQCKAKRIFGVLHFQRGHARRYLRLRRIDARLGHAVFVPVGNHNGDGFCKTGIALLRGGLRKIIGARRKAIQIQLSLLIHIQRLSLPRRAPVSARIRRGKGHRIAEHAFGIGLIQHKGDRIR